jgi:IS605 OrfB family transposase
MRAPDIRAVDDGFLCMGRRFSIWRSRDLPANAVIKDGSSFSQDAAGHWYLNISISIPDGDAREPERKVGIDLGLKSLATLSTGETVGAPRLYRASEAALAMAQRARKSKRTQRIHAKIANRRKDFLHKLSTRLVQEFDLIAVGNVSPSQLAKTKMAKSIHDAGWGDLRNMIAYKAVRHGARYVEADERNSTRCCSECGSLGGPKGVQHLVIREWQCRDCGAVHDRDTNSALNILRNGLVALIEEPASAREKPKGRIANA